MSIHGYTGLGYPGLRYPGLRYPGLYKTINIAPFQTMYHIIRLLSNPISSNPISSNHVCPYTAYHRYDGLSMSSLYRRIQRISHIETLDIPHTETAQNGRVQKEYPNIPIGIYKAYKDIKVCMV